MEKTVGLYKINGRKKKRKSHGLENILPKTEKLL
jgi:hypothetical protein